MDKLLIYQCYPDLYENDKIEKCNNQKEWSVIKDSINYKPDVFQFDFARP